MPDAPLNPMICGRWDGVHLWVQWDDAAPTQGYRMQVRLWPQLPKPAADWMAWRDIGGPSPLRRAWMNLPLHQHDAKVEVRVAIAPASGDPQWQPAREVTFATSRCRFSFTAGQNGLHYKRGQEFAAIVDGVGCHYLLQEEIQLAAGAVQETEMVASVGTAWSQLDKAGDFMLRPSLGEVIQNIAASTEDVTATGSESTTLVGLPQNAKLKLVIGGKVM